MDTVITAFLSKLALGDVQSFENLAVIPLFAPVSEGPSYLTLKEASEQRLLTVTEVDGGGSVPELKAVNNGDLPVLLLDGEELAGAKQNRVLNTTILLKAKSETVIPVTCTEQGRWAYVSPVFQESGVVMPTRQRARKVGSVSESLRTERRFQADQTRVWHDIEDYLVRSRGASPTRALRAAFESQTKPLEDYLKALDCLPHQRGLLAFVNGDIAGLEIISRESAYASLHPKLVKSYALDALLEGNGKPGKPDKSEAEAFFKEAAACEATKYKSLGHGWDHRLEGGKIVGSALVYRTVVIHLALFRTEESEKVGPMTGYRRRRGFRL